MDAKRPVRPSALRAQQTLDEHGHHTTPSSDDDEFALKPNGRGSRRVGRIDLSKLEASSLLRYRKFFNLGDVPANTSQEDLVPSVARHFEKQVVEEDKVLQKFIVAVQRHNRGGTPQPGHGPLSHAPNKPLKRPLGVNGKGAVRK